MKSWSQGERLNDIEKRDRKWMILKSGTAAVYMHF